MRSTHRHPGVGLVLGALLLGLVGCGDDDVDTGGDQTASTTTAAPASTTTTEATTSTEAPADQIEVRAYFIREEHVGPVAREATDEAVAADAMEGLLAGPTAQEQEIGFSSAIPAGTELLGIVIEDRVATVDLSEEFGSGGGSQSMMARVAQVVFTLTQFDTVDAVRFEMEGVPVTALGGEGLLLGEPQTRADWEDLSPAILLESPLPFAEVTSPLRIAGTANVFEAQFRVNVTDGEGLIVFDEPVMATSGTGTRGTFEVTASFDVPRAGLGAVIVFDHSERDGSVIDLVEVPVQVSG